MVLGRLFGALFARGVVIVATSNRPPDDLYLDGLNRAVFLPFIALLKDRLDVHELEGPTDHRLGMARGGQVWFSPLGPGAPGRTQGRAPDPGRDGSSPPAIFLPFWPTWPLALTEARRLAENTG